jgi:hypothetical protein
VLPAPRPRPVIYVTPLCAARFKVRAAVESLLLAAGASEDIFIAAFLGDLPRWRGCSGPIPALPRRPIRPSTSWTSHPSSGTQRDGAALRGQGRLPTDHRGPPRIRSRPSRARQPRPDAARLAGTSGTVGVARGGPAPARTRNGQFSTVTAMHQLLRRHVAHGVDTTANLIFSMSRLLAKQKRYTVIGADWVLSTR